MHIYTYGRRTSSVDHQTPKHRQKLWDLLCAKVSAEHRALETTNPTSPRIKPTVGLVGWVLR